MRPLPLSQSTIQDCLVSWRTGTAVGKSYASPDKINPYVEITTKQHAYVFSISHDMVYCRAARYAACEKGMVFAQNIRISQIEKYGKQAYMLPDNTLALEPLIIKPDYFDFDTCTVTPEEEGGKMARLTILLLLKGITSRVTGMPHRHPCLFVRLLLAASMILLLFLL